MKRRKWISIAVVVVLVLLPWIVYTIYRKQTALPRQVTIATGPEGGLYRDLMEALAEELRGKLEIDVRLVQTQGSLENYYLLHEGAATGTLDYAGEPLEGKVDFALYQPGTLEILAESPRPGSENVRSVANLYSQPAHFIVRHGAGISVPSELRGKRVAVGLPNSGDRAMSRMLLDHFGLDEQAIEPQQIDYAQIKARFDDGTLDAAFFALGTQAPVFTELLATGQTQRCDLLDVPCAEAFVAKHVSASICTIPRGLYQSCPHARPAADVKTVSLGAQLLTRQGVDAGLVSEVARVVTGEDFVKRNQLKELFERGQEFAQEKPEFPVHPGARSLYDPDFDIHTFEGWEALYSLVASALIAIFLGGRWFREQRSRRQKHWLDSHIRTLLEIEKQQIALDGVGGADDLETLQRLLDRVTLLRQEAFSEFQARELIEDRAADCFVQMCHALSNKINAKISRQRLDIRFNELIDAVRRQA